MASAVLAFVSAVRVEWNLLTRWSDLEKPQQSQHLEPSYY